MSTCPQAVERQEKTRGIGTEDEVQTHILAGTVGVLKGGVTEVEVGAEINPIGIKSPGAPVSGNPPIPVTADITEAYSSCPVDLKMNYVF
jgi:hypothetical protein